MLPTNAKDRKDTPIFSGVIKYFPDALAEIARVSKAGNDQHNPGQPLHWDRSKSTDHLDCAQRHLIEAGTVDTDGQRHTAKLAWRALAQLQTELEAERELYKSPWGPTDPALWGDDEKQPDEPPTGGILSGFRGEHSPFGSQCGCVTCRLKPVSDVSDLLCQCDECRQFRKEI